MCPRLLIPFVYDPGPDLLSMEAIASPPAYQRARAAVRYDEVARTLVHALKYQDRTDLAPAMGRWMTRAGRELLDGADIAHSRAAALARASAPPRYNQSGALARVIERQSGIKLRGDILQRVRATEQQVEAVRPQRASNVQGAFKVSADRQSEIAGRRLILIDDVLTSGATTDACARAACCAPRRHRSTCWCSRGVVDTPKAPHIIRALFREAERDMTAAIEIYTRPGCGYCSAAKSHQNRKKATFTEYDAGKDSTVRQQMYDRAGAGTTFPQIFIGETHIGGCDELYALDREGKLDGMLAGEKAFFMSAGANMFTAAMVQMRTSLLPEPSLEQGIKLIREAVAKVADYVQTPEVSNMMQLNRKALFEHLQSEENDASLKAYRELAKELKIHLHIGLAGAAVLAGEGRQPLVPDRAGRHDPRLLRQDPHVRYRSAGRRDLPRDPPITSRARPP